MPAALDSLRNLEKSSLRLRGLHNQRELTKAVSAAQPGCSVFPPMHFHPDKEGAPPGAERPRASPGARSDQNKALADQERRPFQDQFDASMSTWRATRAARQCPRQARAEPFAAMAQV